MSSVLRTASAASVIGPRRHASVQAVPQLHRFAHYVARPFLQFGPILFAAVVGGILLFAWEERDEGYLTAESGAGYWLGIVGSIIMLMLVAYPMRKRFRNLHGLGRVANWFRFHMIMGIVGPTLVILHTNFKLGSLNSQLTLFTMLVVVASGIVGRYLYAKIHKGLYGKQVEVRDVLSDIAALKHDLVERLDGRHNFNNELQRYVSKNGNATPSVLGSFRSAVLAGPRTRASRNRCKREAKKYLATRSDLSRRQRSQELKKLDQYLRIFFAAAKKAERLAFFERVFGMWHHLHMPLFILLALAVVIHIVAVHLY